LRLVKPTVGVLTSVGPQHLETFKTIERVAKTKYELIEALPENSHSYFCDDHAICKQLYDRTAKPKTLVSLTPGEADVWSEHVAVSSEGSAFDRVRARQAEPSAAYAAAGRAQNS
jgi:UDP-N-acetylmuramoyl-tripeptide--D-alanyl-D-alanine ligase